MKRIFLLIFFLTMGLLTGCAHECDHESIIIDNSVEATCTEHGLTEGSHCGTCGKILIEQKIIEPLGHDVVLDGPVSPNCEMSGKSAGAHCSRCNTIIIQQNIIEPLGHIEVIDEAVEPTCTQTGLTEGSHCKTCGKVIVAQEVIPAKGHEPIIDNSVEPTCTKHGLTEGSHCKVCGEILVHQEIIEPLGHEFVFDNPIDSTCSQEGKTLGLHCSRCGEQLIEQECVLKKPHTKGKFIDLTISSVENVKNPGLFECKVCHQQYYDTISYEDVGIPLLTLNGDMSGISKENKKKITAVYSDVNQSFELNATLKLQGSSSINYPKKNYNIQFFKDNSFSSKQKIQFVEGWGKQNKYTLKANYIDFSEMRNVVSGKIYGDVVHSRNIADQFDSLINGGAIDGYPIILFQNGVFHGLYTLNTSKDDYLFGMDGDETTREAMLMVNDWGNTGRLQEHIPEDFGPTWELEYASTEDNQDMGVSWVRDSFNEMIDFVNNNDGQVFIDGIRHYINVERAIDSMLYTWAIKATDNVSKNILWVTYDGVQWMPSVYDMDGTWGCYWDGDMNVVGTNSWTPKGGNVLWAKLYSNMHDAIVDRWEELRNGPLSISNIDKKFVDFYKTIPGWLFKLERSRWLSVPSQNTNHVTQIVNWAIEYFKNLDTAFGVSIDENVGCKVSINNSEHVNIKFYLSGDYGLDPNQTNVCYARDSETGYLVASGGQTNIELFFDDGFELDEILIDGSFKNLKNPADTGKENVYRITKITSNLNVTIKTKASA